MLGGCPYCPAAGQERRSSRTAGGRWVRECGGCGRVVEELGSASHDLFYLRAQDSPLCVVTPDLIFDFPASFSSNHTPDLNDGDDGSNNAGSNNDNRIGGDDDGDDNKNDDDPFESPGFITAFSTWSLESVPTPSLASFSYSGLLAQLERSLLLDSPSSSPSPSASASSSALPTTPAFLVDNLRARLQIMEVGSLLKLDWDILDHSFQLFRDCSTVTCLRNRNVEALATAALLHAIREAQEPRTLQEISTAANLPQKEIGKYIKILGEALKLSQPINSNSISVHMPRFCKLLQLNPVARDIATHIGEVVVNKCFCTRRNPISISAAAIYLACQLEDKRKTQAEICKVTGLTEVTLRKVYKELLENWDDLLPPNYTPAVPPEKAFPMTCIPSGRSLTPKLELTEIPSSATVHEVSDKQIDINNPNDPSRASQIDCLVQQREKSIMECNPGIVGANHDLSIQISEVCGGPSSSQPPLFKPDNIKNENIDWQIDINQTLLDIIDLDEGSNRDENVQTSKLHSGPSSSTVGSTFWPLSGGPSHDHILRHEVGLNSSSEPPWNRSSSKCFRNHDDFKDNRGPGNFR